MNAVVPVDRLYSVGVVVKDLEAATRRHAELFGIDRWVVRELTADRLTDIQSYGRPTTASFRTATGTAPGGAVTFELVQPLSGESPFERFRALRRQGVCHLTLAVRDRDSFASLRSALARNGLRLAASMTVDGRLERHFIDTREALGGYLVEVQVPLDGGSAASLRVDEQWDHSGTYERPPGVEPLPITSVGHFGIVVRDMHGTLERYAHLLGAREWGVRDWRTEPGLLESPYYRGEQVDHEYYTGLAQFRDFGFEIIQPTFGPSHYNRDFLDRTGEGIHHILLTVLTAPENWERTVTWLESVKAPLVMGADLMKGAAHFCYFEPGPSIGGYVVETVILRRSPDQPPEPDYVIDFAAGVAQ